MRLHNLASMEEGCNILSDQGGAGYYAVSPRERISTRITASVLMLLQVHRGGLGIAR
jgi:hypothetical protein